MESGTPEAPPVSFPSEDVESRFPNGPASLPRAATVRRPEFTGGPPAREPSGTARCLLKAACVALLPRPVLSRSEIGKPFPVAAHILLNRPGFRKLL